MEKNNTWTNEESRFLQGLNTPQKIQGFLDGMPYNTDEECRSPRRVMRDHKAYCTEGAFFAAAALRFHDYGCNVLDMRAVNDDDHVIALFKRNNCYGAIAKSNFTGLRFREPVYKTLRELVMSYFEFYFNTAGEKTLRSYSLPLNLSRFDHLNWMTTESNLEFIGDFLNSIRHIDILTKNKINNLGKVDKKTYDAGLLGSDPEGLYKPTI